jgi:hypothetical protein
MVNSNGSVIEDLLNRLPEEEKKLDTLPEEESNNFTNFSKFTKLKKKPVRKKSSGSTSQNTSFPSVKKERSLMILPSTNSDKELEKNITYGIITLSTLVTPIIPLSILGYTLGKRYSEKQSLKKNFKKRSLKELLTVTGMGVGFLFHNGLTDTNLINKAYTSQGIEYSIIENNNFQPTFFETLFLPKPTGEYSINFEGSSSFCMYSLDGGFVQDSAFGKNYKNFQVYSNATTSVKKKVWSVCADIIDENSLLFKF